MPELELGPNLVIHYLDLNPQSSRTVLLLHGLGVDCTSWQLQMPPLVAAGFRVVAPDARGFGKSTCPGGRLNIASMAADVANLLQSLQVGPAHVVGISMGGTHALQLALDYSNLVDKLVLVNTFARLQPDRLSGWFYFALRFVLAHTVGLTSQARRVAHHLFPGSDQQELRRFIIDQIAQADPRGYRAAMRALAFFDVRLRLKEIITPTLVITAENDRSISPKNQHILADRIPNARQVIIPGAGHAVTVDQAGLFNQFLIDFLLYG